MRLRLVGFLVLLRVPGRLLEIFVHTRAPDGVITMELAKGSILNEETRRKSQGSSSQSDVLVTERRGRSQSRGPSNRGNHRSSSSKGKFADVEYELFVCYDYDMVNLANDDSSWILDSGATCHVATRKDYYSSYTPGDFGVVRMGNTRLSRIAGIGDICLKFDTGMELVLHNVKHVPDMRLNIISTGLLDEDGYHNSSGNGLWKVTLGSLIMARGKRESKLYMTHPKISKSIVNTFVTFIDDHSRKVWVYTLKSKDQVLDVFKQFHALVERQTRKKLKCIRTDNGGLPASFWDEALNTSSDERSSLMVKVSYGVFRWYGQDEFGYRLYDPVQKRLVRSRDVVFEEDQTLKDVENAERETIPQHNDDLIDWEF
ncbi:retrovirus-related pol polyprotein from transposon TNT 1-94 [Tanacetum coccineum]|uniref:Retrovirus-related pol polyprotein from transposon TNT 1-94 n=1 Tax=Tanacetum coccineum TaxID=301880 RepID=A0ABQ5H1P4_9ASTR